jgi:hypothetical protein
LGGISINLLKLAPTAGSVEQDAVKKGLFRQSRKWMNLMPENFASEGGQQTERL